MALVIVGDGPERALVEGAAEKDTDIVYLGRQPYRILPGLIAGSLCGLVPKNNLGERAETGLFPLKLFETLACGVPVVVSDFPGQADLVRDNDCGITFPAEDSESLARAVSLIAANPVRAGHMGVRGRTAIVNEHSWDLRAGQTADVLTAVREASAVRPR